MSSAPQHCLFSLKQLGLSYRARPALRGIDWTWQPGEHWAVLGPNGAGKSTLAGVLSGELPHFTGTYERSEELRTNGIAYVGFEQGRRLMERDRKLDCAEFENDASDTGTTIRDLLNGENENPLRDQLIELLALAPILNRGLRYVSTGELRKALLAHAILARPALLILDSPLDGLDRQTQITFGSALNTLMTQSPAVLLLCRSLQDVPPACTQLMVLDQGRVALQGTRSEVEQAEELETILAAPKLQFQAPPLAVSRDLENHEEATIDLRNVQVSFGEMCVFQPLNWRLEAQQHCLIAGPNGSGKTTLLDLLTGDNHKAYGQDVRLFGRLRGTGESVWDIKARFGRVDAKLQYAMPSGSTVLSVVLSGHFDSVVVSERPTDGQRNAALEWLRALDLLDLHPHEFHTLSFGLQRLVLLVRAMVKSPAILLLDEATLSLDEGHRRLLLDAVDHVIAEQHCQLLFVSHTAGEVPQCINQRLNFEPHHEGSRVSVTAYP